MSCLYYNIGEESELKSGTEGIMRRERMTDLIVLLLANPRESEQMDSLQIVIKYEKIFNECKYQGLSISFTPTRALFLQPAKII